MSNPSLAVEKPALISSADVLLKLQETFEESDTFAPLRLSQPKRPSKGNDQAFKIGHGGTLDPLAGGVLVVGIGRGTKHLQHFLACKKTYETVIAFGQSTDSYDCTGNVTGETEVGHVTRELVQEQLKSFCGQFRQIPPIYSALKVNGIKACEYAREGKELPRQLDSREVNVDECTVQDWYPYGHLHAENPSHFPPARGPSVRIRLVVSSGFYVRSFAHDLGIACRSSAHMASLLRTTQASYTIPDHVSDTELVMAITYADLDGGELVWAPKLRPQLESWVKLHPPPVGHVDGRNPACRRKTAEDKCNAPRQRFRGGWLAESKEERIKQQGGKYKGKWNQQKRVASRIQNETILL